MNGATAVAAAGRIQAILDSLIGERRRLQADRHDASLLAANRIAIIYWPEQRDRGRPRPRHAGSE